MDENDELTLKVNVLIDEMEDLDKEIDIKDSSLTENVKELKKMKKELQAGKISQADAEKRIELLKKQR